MASTKTGVTALVCAVLAAGAALDAVGILPGPLTIYGSNSAISQIAYTAAAPLPGLELPPVKTSISTATVKNAYQQMWNILQQKLQAAGKGSMIGSWNPAAAPPKQVGVDGGTVVAAAVVRDAHTGKTIFSQYPSLGLPPASNTKVLTAAGALIGLGPQTRFITKAWQAEKNAGDRSVIVLSSDGDIMLGSGASNPRAITGHAGLITLAQQVKKNLAPSIVGSAAGVAVTLASSSWPPEARRPGIEEKNANYVGVSTPIALNSGRSGAGYQGNPRKNVLDAFVQALRQVGIKAIALPQGSAYNTGYRAAGKPLGEIASATVEQQLQTMLVLSDNTLAENFCHVLAKKTGLPPKWTSGPKALINTLKDAGFNTDGLHLDDCSGLSRGNRESANLLSDVIVKSVEADPAQLRALVSQLPVGHLNGTLSSRFATLPGEVSAKTGTITASISLTGVVNTASGQQLAFSVIITNLSDDTNLYAREAIDKFVEVLARAQ